jgi:hypothetical protein
LNDNELNVAYGFQMVTIGDQIDVDFNQFEPLAATQFASSPMASAGAVRAADVWTFPAAGNIDFTQGTAYAELTTNWTSGPQSINAALGTGLNGRILWNPNGVASTNIRTFDGANQAIKGGMTDMSTAVRKRASSWGAAGQFVTGDGAAPATAAFDGTMGDGVVLEIGNTADGSQWNGTIKNVRIYPTQLTSAQLQALTA